MKNVTYQDLLDEALGYAERTLRPPEPHIRANDLMEECGWTHSKAMRFLNGLVEQGVYKKVIILRKVYFYKGDANNGSKS